MGPLEAYNFYRQGRSIAALPGAIRAFSADANVQTAWTLGGRVVGVIGTERVVRALVKYSLKLGLKSRGVDRSAGEEMVALMRSRVRVDTGRLYNGIDLEESDGLITITAEAVHTGKDHNYARDVEFGRHARVHADASFFETGAEAGAPLRRRQPVGDGSVPPHPFFFNSEQEVLNEWPGRLNGAIDDAAQEEGWRS
jgi:hypothetical protein